MTPFLSLDAEAVACMDRGAFAEAVGFWELLLGGGGDLRLLHGLLYALSLARAGRPEDARDTLTAARLELEDLPPGAERQSLMELLRAVTAAAGEQGDRPVSDPAPLFSEF